MNYTDIVNKGFTCRATYLVWRAAWKGAYSVLTEQIRMHKKDRKNPDPAVRGGAQYSCVRLRQKATQMLEQRKQSKVEAQRQYLAAKSVVTA